MKAQATSVDDGDSEWRGMCVFPGHEAGPLLRDWTVVMAALAARPAAERPTEPAPMVFFEGSLPLSPEEDKEGWKERHVALTLDERDEMFTVRIYYMAHNFGVERLVRARVIGPDGQALADSQRKMHPGTPPFAVEVPADGKKGVYAVEAFSTIRRCPARIESTLGKTVHLAPGKTLSLYSPVYAGRVWFEPKGDEEVVFGHPVNEPAGRIAAFGPDGVLLASSRLTGTRNAAVSGVQIPQPVGEPCRFRPKAAGIHSLVAGVDKPSAPDMPVSGIRPFLAGRHDEWFDPTRYPCPSLDALARQAKAPAPR
jgi:hypothetical protein